MTTRSRTPACSTCSAGTGWLGHRSGSRAAQFTLFVDNGRSRALLRNNVEALGLGGVTKVYSPRRHRSRPGPSGRAVSLVFLDPPYAKGLAEKSAGLAARRRLADAGALLVVEEAKARLRCAGWFLRLERRVYDDTEFAFLAV